MLGQSHMATVVPDLGSFPNLPQGGASAPFQPTRGRSGRGRGRGRAGVVPVDCAAPRPSDGFVTAPTAVNPLEAQLAALTAQVGILPQEIQELRKENFELRRQAEQARGLQQHQPYALSSLPPIPAPQFTPVKPTPAGRTRTASELSPGPTDSTVDVGTGGDTVMSSPTVDVEQKRARRSLELSLENEAPAALGDPQLPGAVPMVAPLPHVE